MKKVRKTIAPKAKKVPQTREIETSSTEKKVIPGELTFYKFGRTETGTPKVNENFGSSPWITFGENNDFPQELMRLYTNASGIHRGIIILKKKSP